MSRKNIHVPNRRSLLLGSVSATGALLTSGVVKSAVASGKPIASMETTSAVTSSNIITTADGTQLYYKDWGSGPTVVLCHGWPLSSDSWAAQMLFLASQGFRTVAHDRRGHGRSSQTWLGNDMDHYADDLATVIERLNLQDIVLVGFSTGGGEVARYIGRHGTRRVAKVVLVSAVTPLMLRTEKNPKGLPIEAFDEIRAGKKPSQGLIDEWWREGMQGGHHNTYESIKAFSETDFTEDLKKIDVPTLIVHGDDDQIVPIEAAGRASVKLIKNSKLVVYPGAPHGLPETHRDKFNADLLSFIRS